MKNFTREDLLFSLCGLNCGLCPMHLDGYCPGCGGGEGNQSCKIAKCSLRHGSPAYCSQCREFACELYADIDKTDSFITHQNRRKDLEKQREMGVEAYQAEQKEKIQLLQWLLKNCNDGRKKTFFCVAVNLLDMETVKQTVEQARNDAVFETLSVKEKAILITERFRRAAEEQGILLKLRRK
ncbi:MAG: DUF3795 domain-containing protein [Eubacteriales bacterium]|nr:DUF3795 domain-containing protein [Eubacteriales bacterium]